MAAPGEASCRAKKPHAASPPFFAGNKVVRIRELFLLRQPPKPAQGSSLGTKFRTQGTQELIGRSFELREKLAEALLLKFQSRSVVK